MASFKIGKRLVSVYHVEIDYTPTEDVFVLNPLDKDAPVKRLSWKPF